jgi:hypothetical protein
MTTRKYSSRSQQTTLSSAIGSADTTMVVGSATTILGGITISAGETFTLVINPDTALEEIVDVYSSSANPVSSNTLTIVRGRDGSTAQEHSAGAVVKHMAVGRDYREANEHINETTTAHGLTLSNLVKVTDTGVVTSSMILNGTITASDIADTTITTAKIADSAITSAKIADLTIASGDIADSAITSGKIATGAVGTAKIDDLSITEGKLASNAVTAGKIATDAVTTAKIQDGAVTSAKIASGTIVNEDIATDAAIAKTKLNLGGTITSADLVDGTIVAADIADATLTAAKFVVDPYARSNHTGTQTASTISDFDTQVRTNRLDQMAAPTGSVPLNAQKITGLGLASSNGDAVSVAWIDSQKGIANGIAELDSNGKVPFEHIPSTAIAEVFVVASQAEMLALPDGIGDIAIRTDLNKSFIQRANPASTLSNWNELLTPTDSVLSVDGSTGAVDLTGVYLNKTTGVLAGNLNANSHKITNLATPTSDADAATKVYVDVVAGSATAAAASAAAAATSYDNFDDRYLGAKSTAPTLDNDGNALLTGAIYWNSVSNAMYAWTGSEWGSISSTADIFRYRFTATGGETTISGLDDNGLTLSYIPGKEQVYLNGVLLVRTTDYTATSGSSLTSLAALAASDILEVVTFTSFELANVLEPTLFDAKGDILVGVSADTAGKLTVGTDGYVLTADSSTATGLKWAEVDLQSSTIMSIMGAY